MPIYQECLLESDAKWMATDHKFVILSGFPLIKDICSQLLHWDEVFQLHFALLLSRERLLSFHSNTESQRSKSNRMSRILPWIHDNTDLAEGLSVPRNSYHMFIASRQLLEPE
jgi:hypothetical protein